jgi:tetratricopeptide (TPR) repeat protein
VRKTNILSKKIFAPLRLCVKLKPHLCILFFLLLASKLSFGQSETANQYYDQKKYNEALQEWNALMDQGAKGEELYYNIANAHYRLHQFPESILFYSKALKWNPNCRDCKQNLKLAQKAAGIESFELPEFFLSKFYHNTLLMLQPMGWLVLGIGLISLLLFMTRFRKDSSVMNSNAWLKYAILSLGIICLFLSFQRDRIKHNTDEVILMKPSGLHLSPDAISDSKQELIPGQTLKIKDHLSGWIKVQTKEFDLGWIEENKVKVIEL